MIIRSTKSPLPSIRSSASSRFPVLRNALTSNQPPSDLTRPPPTSSGLLPCLTPSETNLGKFIISDFYRTETIYAITTLFDLYKKDYRGEELSHKFAIEIGRYDASKSEVTFSGFTKFGLSYIAELGLLDIDEKDLLIEDLSKEQRYQNNANAVESIQLPSDKIPCPNPKKYGRTEKYTTNPRRARNALEKANFKCELNSTHPGLTK